MNIFKIYFLQNNWVLKTLSRTLSMLIQQDLGHYSNITMRNSNTYLFKTQFSIFTIPFEM